MGKRGEGEGGKRGREGREHVNIDIIESGKKEPISYARNGTRVTGLVYDY